MVRQWTTIIGIAAVMLSALAFAASDPAGEKKLQQAIDLVDSRGDLARAIPLFEEVSRSPDRALAARALLHLGQAQERQARERARATYEKILKEFGNQAAIADVARKRLNALAWPRPLRRPSHSALRGV
jgi:tetratricopeptide (TPR) repeat protein